MDWGFDPLEVWVVAGVVAANDTFRIVINKPARAKDLRINERTSGVGNKRKNYR
jgi:hypothetical protein